MGAKGSPLPRAPTTDTPCSRTSLTRTSVNKGWLYYHGGIQRPAHHGVDDGQGVERMARCVVCGNEYDKASEAVMPGKDSHTFDSFERAIYALAPTCEHCGCRLIGRGT